MANSTLHEVINHQSRRRNEENEKKTRFGSLSSRGSLAHSHHLVYVAADEAQENISAAKVA
jgi:hypothetical protein